jgi:SAM-dependent methyltransferase
VPATAGGTPVEDVCPACGAAGGRTLFHCTDRLYRTTGKSFLIVECADCRLIRLSPVPAPDELRTYYPPGYWFVPEANTPARLEEAYRRFVLGDHVRFVERALAGSAARGPVLDIGCGGGLFLGLLRERGYRVAGLDVSHGAARAAWKVNRVPSLVGSVPEGPLRRHSFAAVTMFHVLEHLYHPEEYLLAAADLLLPDGRLIVQVPNAACWQFVLMGENWNGIDVPRHLIDFTAKQLDNLLDYCGFEVLRHKHF